MNKKKITKIVNDIIAEIDLNYLIAEAVKNNYDLILVHGELDTTIEWSTNTYHIPCNYELAVSVLHYFIGKNMDKIIKLKSVSKFDCVYGLNRNTIIYVPYEYDIELIRKQYYNTL